MAREEKPREDRNYVDVVSVITCFFDNKGYYRNQLEILKDILKLPYVNLKEVDTDVLDKIKTEIENEYGQCDICTYFEDYDYEEYNISEYRPVGDITNILQIIDKYKEKRDK